MWNILKEKDKAKYQSLITNFASLSEAFTQKADGENINEHKIVTPIINSKFQETVFQKAFSAVGEDIANTSFDASLEIDEGHRYLIGIKSFGLTSGDQKIAQFKKNSSEWGDILGEIKLNASMSKTKEIADNLNLGLYTKLALEISKLRNERIESSKAQIRGFITDDINVESVYHVLMPSVNGNNPQIHVGETSYLPIDISNLKILGATSLKNPINFRFTDGNHVYKYTAADSQLLMTFNNKEIVVDTWDVTYVEDPFYIFGNLQSITSLDKKDNILQTVSWVIANKNNQVESSSGFNGFNGGSKLSRENNYREKRIENLLAKHRLSLSKEELEVVEEYLNVLLIRKYRTDKQTTEMRKVRAEFMSKLSQLNNDELVSDIEKLIYRDSKEVYIPIPESKHFHNQFPDFFGPSIGTFSNGRKLALPKGKRIFTLKFLPSGDEIEAYINQENGKAIQSTRNQGILGEWLLHGIFQLKEREPLTYEKLEDLHINAIRLFKYSDTDAIGIEFTWIDTENPPEDAIGWVAKNKI
ncbi:hypothetical protein [Streptococcus parauberis]|uniref:hypothetical protein n=1 Tax=Streptococcus parauberis TaxID=1348 RepID=UPI0037ABEDDC